MAFFIPGIAVGFLVALGLCGLLFYLAVERPKLRTMTPDQQRERREFYRQIYSNPQVTS